MRIFLKGTVAQRPQTKQSLKASWPLTFSAWEAVPEIPARWVTQMAEGWQAVRGIYTAGLTGPPSLLANGALAMCFTCRPLRYSGLYLELVQPSVTGFNHDQKYINSINVVKGELSHQEPSFWAIDCFGWFWYILGSINNHLTPGRMLIIWHSDLEIIHYLACP